MFVLTSVADTIRIPPPMLGRPTKECIESEIDKKYPNRVIMDVGLAVTRYDCLEIGDGVCVAGDGGSHHEVVFRLVVFRPFVEEVCVGYIVESTEEGIRISLGFFENIFVPAYWMLRPSQFDYDSKLWVWVPSYDDDNNDDGEEDDDGDGNHESNNEKNDKGDANGAGGGSQDGGGGGAEEKEAAGEPERFEMEIGSEIRFRVKSLNFTQVTTHAKGVQATTTSTSSRGGSGGGGGPNSSSGGGGGGGGGDSDFSKPVRKRSSSVDLSDSRTVPASMHITASICEDGLGLTSWWSSSAAEEAEDEEEEGLDEGDQGYGAGEGGEDEDDDEYGGEVYE